ncbi:hypothetical protein [Rhodococcus sp. RDE2]|uniref:hypothetical protein n=1 Tax=Rhodococcus sp. RDE2 TaxID=2885078 RepID=UPI001E5773EC|nr:hypothetical protein [Rhodococcus sp. RDE2]BDB59566.1 hypothetical protein RDE2_13600 [Rhodococcus sp. RDE2]
MTPKPPTGTRAAGRRLWSAVVDDYELAEHELQILREAVRTVDLIDALHKVAGAEGPLAESSQGIRVHPALVELRQQRITLARLLAALNIPSEDVSARAPRGVYDIRGTG